MAHYEEKKQGSEEWVEVDARTVRSALEADGYSYPGYLMDTVMKGLGGEVKVIHCDQVTYRWVK